MGWGQCMSVCPVGAISPNSEQKAVVDWVLCRGCSACVEACPVGAIRMGETTAQGPPQKGEG